MVQKSVYLSQGKYVEEKVVEEKVQRKWKKPKKRVKIHRKNEPTNTSTKYLFASLVDLVKRFPKSLY